MSSENPALGALLVVVRLAFLVLLIGLVLLFILAKSGSAKKEDGEAAESAVQSELSEGEFGKGWTDLKYRVKSHQAGGNLNYELFIYPYDQRIGEQRTGGTELVLLSFVDGEQARIVPQKAPVRIEMRALERVLAEDEQGRKFFSGWLISDEVKQEESAGGKIAAAEMGWLFSNDLLALLRDLRKERLIREAQQRPGESSQAGVSAR